MRKVNIHRRVLILVSVAAAACGCGTGTEHHTAPVSTEAAPPAVEPLAKIDPAGIGALPSELNGSWTLAAIDGAPVTAAAQAPTLEILEDGSVSGVGGINRFQTRLGVVDGRLSFGPVAATKMAGPPEAMELESSYLTRLGAVSTFEIHGDTLRLSADDNEALTFVRGGE